MMWNDYLVNEIYEWSKNNFEGNVQIIPSSYNGPLSQNAQVRFINDGKSILITPISDYLLVKDTKKILGDLIPLIKNWIKEYENKKGEA